MQRGLEEATSTTQLAVVVRGQNWHLTTPIVLAMVSSMKPNPTDAEILASKPNHPGSARMMSHMRSIQQRILEAPFQVTDSCGVTRGFDTQAEADAWRARIS